MELRICLPLLRQRPAQWLSRHPLVKHLLVGIVSIVQASSYSSTSATCGGITQLMADLASEWGGGEGGRRENQVPDISAPLCYALDNSSGA